MGVGSALLVLLTCYQALAAISTVPVDLRLQKGSPRTFNWVPLPSSNETCETDAPPYVRCERVLPRPPHLVGHTLVELEEFDTGAPILAAFGGRTSSGNELYPSNVVHNGFYLYDTRTRWWWDGLNENDTAARPIARQGHVAWSAPLSEEMLDVDIARATCKSKCRMLVHGGFGSHGLPLSDLWEFYNGTFNELIPSSGGAPQLAGHSVVWDARNRLAYFYGGFGPEKVLQSDIWVLNLDNRTWSTVVTSGAEPKPRAYHAAVLLPSFPLSPPYQHVGPWEQTFAVDVMVVIGGTVVDGSEMVSTSEMLKFHLNTSTWEVWRPLPGGYRMASTNMSVKPFALPLRSGHTCYRVQQRALCFGGWHVGPHNDALEYDPALDRVLVPPFATAPPSKMHGAVGLYSYATERHYLLGGTVGRHGGIFDVVGFFESNAIPNLCPNGEFSPDGDWRCFDCPPGHSSAAYDCPHCPPGSFAAEDKRFCLACPPGHYSTQTGNENVTDCEPCPAGTYLPAGGGVSVASCLPCPAGTYSNDTGVMRCTDCPAGTFGSQTGMTTLWEGCEICPYGSSSHKGSSSCTPCPPGTESVPMVRRLWPFSVQIIVWGQMGSSCSSACPVGSACDSSTFTSKCTSCPLFICGTCRDDGSGSYVVKAGQPVFFRVGVFDTGQLVNSAPNRMLGLNGMLNFDRRPDGTITVEKISGAGDLNYRCQTAHPDPCNAVANGEAWAEAVAGGPEWSNNNECYSGTSATYRLWRFFSVRFDTATPETTLVFRSHALLPARITLKVEGDSIHVLHQPPNSTVAAHPFEITLILSDVLGNRDPSLSHAVTLEVPRCVQVLNGQPQSSTVPVQIQVDGNTPSAVAQTGLGPLTNGIRTLSVAVSGPTFAKGLEGLRDGDDKGTMIQCTLTFTAEGGSRPSVATLPFFVRHPYRVDVTHVSSTFPGSPVHFHIRILDPDDEVVISDNKTVVTLSLVDSDALYKGNETLNLPNATLEAVEGTSLAQIVSMGEADIYARFMGFGVANLRVDPTQPYASIYIIPNSTIRITSQPVNFTASQLAITPPHESPHLSAWPSVIMANHSIRVGVRAVNEDLKIDLHANFLVKAELVGCSAPAELRPLGNATGLEPIAQLHLGQGEFEFMLVGPDTTGCRIRFSYVPAGGDPPEWAGVTSVDTDPIDVKNPQYMDISWDVASCTQPTCTYADCYAQTSKKYQVNVTLKAGDGTTVTWAKNAAVNMTTTAPRGVVEMWPKPMFYDSAFARFVDGKATFHFRFNERPYGGFALSFQAGVAEDLTLYNETYSSSLDRVVDGGTYWLDSFVHTKDPLSTHSVVDPWLMDPYTSCSLRLVTRAVHLVVKEPQVKWLPAEVKFTLNIEAQDELGNWDTDLAGDFRVSIFGCEAGLSNMPRMLWVKDETTTYNVTDALALPTLSAGRATIELFAEMEAMHWEHDIKFMTARGAKECNLRFQMPTPPTGYTTVEGKWEPFEIVMLAEVCHSCPLGYWSPGGDGTWYTSKHTYIDIVGGCIPCMVGTYSTKDRASSEADCLTCPAGYGYSLPSGADWDNNAKRNPTEGVVKCLKCGTGTDTVGQDGGGSCTQISGASSALTNQALGGQIGHYCGTSRCRGCNSGLYALVCSQYSANAQQCSHADTQGYCHWVGGACEFVDKYDEPVKCVKCPPGTFQPNTDNSLGITSCQPCGAGSYSSNWGHVDFVSGDRDARGCYDNGVVSICLGSGTGQCPDGTYGVKTGMTNSSDCAKCPRGTWSKQHHLYVRQSLCAAGSSGYPQPVGGCTAITGSCPKCTRTSNGNVCVTGQTLVDSVGGDRCFKCPAGTYSLAEGATEHTTCIPCPPGYYCHIGTADPVPADLNATTIHQALKKMLAGAETTTFERETLDAHPGAKLGVIPTRAYSLGESTEPIYCDVFEGHSSIHDSEGWVKDGHFSDFMWKESYPHEFSGDGQTGFKDHWGIVSGEVRGAMLSTTVDHTDPLNNMAAVCSSVGGWGSIHNYGPTQNSPNDPVDGQTGVYYCCPTLCDPSASPPGPDCGGLNACSQEAYNSSCCKATIQASQRTCGPNAGPPCIITGPGYNNPPAPSSGSLRMNATSDPVSQLVYIKMVNDLPIHVRFWSRNNIIVTDNMATGNNSVGTASFGLKWVLFNSLENVTRDLPFDVVTLPTTDPSVPGSGTWALSERIIRSEAGPIYAVRIETYLEGVYEGLVYYDDISIRVDPAFACNCSLGYFFNATRLGIPEFATPCQRCRSGYRCSGGVLVECPDGSYTQGGAHQCFDCPQGWLCDYDGRGTSTPCPYLMYENEDPNIDQCLICPVGYACRDGKRYPCNYGAYGDGGQFCKLCLPGYFSNLTDQPVTECTRCQPGEESNYMRTGCVACEPNMFSWNGTRCVNCPPHTFSEGTRNSECKPCSTTPLPDLAVTMVRNQIMAPLHLIPEKCIPGVEWRIERYVDLDTPIGNVTWQNPPEVDTFAATYYLVQGTLGTHRMLFTVTSALGAPAQTVTVTVTVTNPAPVTADDVFSVVHTFGNPMSIEIHNLLENDIDPNNDHIFIESWRWKMWEWKGSDTNTYPLPAHHGVTSVTIDSTRKKLFVSLPAWFQGPMDQLEYRVVDHSPDPSCTPPTCEVSQWSTITIIAKDSIPVSTPDAYTIKPSSTNLFDVLANDTDADLDRMYIVEVSKSEKGVVPIIRPLCPPACSNSSPVHVLNVNPVPPAVGTYSFSTCVFNFSTGLCDVELVHDKGVAGIEIIYGPTAYVEYSALPDHCGTDKFTYTVKSNEDITSTSVVTVTVVECICTGSPNGIEILFLTDGSGSEVVDKWVTKKAFFHGIQRRLDFAGHVRVGMYQYAGVGSKAVVHQSRLLDNLPIMNLSMIDKLELPDQTEATDLCPFPPCSDIVPALKAVQEAFTSSPAHSSWKKVLVYIFDKPASDDPTYTVHNFLPSITRAVFTVGPHTVKQGTFLSSGYLQHFDTHADLLADSSVFSKFVDSICQ